MITEAQMARLVEDALSEDIGHDVATAAGLVLSPEEERALGVQIMRDRCRKYEEGLRDGARKERATPPSYARGAALAAAIHERQRRRAESILTDTDLKAFQETLDAAWPTPAAAADRDETSLRARARKHVSANRARQETR